MKKKIIALIETNGSLKKVSEGGISKKLKESINGDKLDGAKTITLEGKCIEFNEWSVNDRFYNKENFLEEFYRIAKLAEKGKLFGSADHPEDDEDFIVKSGKIACIIEKLWYVEEEDACYIRLKLIPTLIGGGHDLMVVVANGGVLSVSLRALGFMDEETKEAFVDTMYTFDVVAMAGFANTEQRIVDFETKKKIDGVSNLSLFESVSSMTSADNTFKKGDEVTVNLDNSVEAVMVLVEDSFINSSMICAKAQIEEGEVYDICYNENTGEWSLDDDGMEELTEAINTIRNNKKRSMRLKESVTEKLESHLLTFTKGEDKSLNSYFDDAGAHNLPNTNGFLVIIKGDGDFLEMHHAQDGDDVLKSAIATRDLSTGETKFEQKLNESNTVKIKIKSLRKLKESVNPKYIKRLIENGENVEEVNDSFEPIEDEQEIEAVQNAVETGGDENFEIISESENGVVFEDKNTGDIYEGSSESLTEGASEDDNFKVKEFIAKNKNGVSPKEIEDAFPDMKAKYLISVLADLEKDNVVEVKGDLIKLKESLSIMKTKKLFENEGVSEVSDSFEMVEADEEDLQLVQNAVDAGGDENFEVVSTDEAGNVLVEDANNGDVFLAGTEELVEAGTIDLAKDVANDLLPKVKAEKKTKGTFTVADLEKMMKKGGANLELVDTVMANLVSMGFDFDQPLNEADDSKKAEVKKLRDKISANRMSIAQLKSKKSATGLANKDNIARIERENEKLKKQLEKLNENQKMKVVKRLSKLKENASVLKTKRLFEAEGVEGVEEYFAPVDADKEDKELVQTAIDAGGDENFELVEQDEAGNAIIEDTDNGDLYLAELGEEKPSALVESLKKRKKLKESFGGKKIKSLRRLKENEDEAEIANIVSEEGAEKAMGSFEDEPLVEEDTQLIQDAIMDGDVDFEVLAENEDHVVIKDPETEEVMMAEVEEDTPQVLTESVRKVKKILKLKESAKGDFRKRLKENEEIPTEEMAKMFEETEADAEDLQFMQDAIDDPNDQNGFETITENDDCVVVEDTEGESDDVYLVETEMEEVPVQEPDAVVELAQKLNETIETVNKLQVFAEEASEVITNIEDNDRGKVLEILKENQKTQLFTKKIQRIVESAPKMKMYEADEEMMMAFDGLDDEQKEEIVEGVDLLTRDELMEAINSYK